MDENNINMLQICPIHQALMLIHLSEAEESIMGDTQTFTTIKINKVP